MLVDACLAEIRMFAGNFAPVNWALCNGQLLDINSNEALFALLGTTYGGNGITTFGLPDLRGRFPIHEGQGAGLTSRTLGQRSGSEFNTITVAQMPAHSHIADTQVISNASSAAGTLTTPSGNIPAVSGMSDPDWAEQSAANAQLSSTMNSATTTIATSGGGQPVNNMAPFLCINFIICTNGIFPSRS